jgi:hypothetical protein
VQNTSILGDKFSLGAVSTTTTRQRGGGFEKKKNFFGKKNYKNYKKLKFINL